MKEIGIYRLFRDNENVGVFTSMKRLRIYIRDWEWSYFNQDEYDPEYKPKWKIMKIEEEEK